MSISARSCLEIELHRFIMRTCQNSEDLLCPKALLFGHGGRRCGCGDALQPVQGGELVVLSGAQSEAPGQGLLDRADALRTELDEEMQADWRGVSGFTQSNVQLLSLSGGSVEAPPGVKEDPDKWLVSQSFQRFKSGDLPRFLRQGANKFKSWSGLV